MQWKGLKRAFHPTGGGWAFVFLFPAMVALLGVAGWPLLSTIYLSFTDASLLSLDATKSFVGFEHYQIILQDPEWWSAVRNTVVFALCSVSLETVFGLGLALVLNQRFRGRALVRAAILVPWAIPTVVSSKLWAWMLNDLYGVINTVAMSLGWISKPIAWLSESRTAMLSLVVVDVWKTTPFMALLLLAGLQTIPREVQEAAVLECDSRWRRFYRITLPLLMPSLTVAVVFRALDALRVFDLIYVLTGTNASTATVSVYARQRLMEFQEFGYGSAASVLIFLMVALLTVGYLRMVRRFSPREVS